MGDLTYGGGINVGWGDNYVDIYIYHNNMKRNWANFCITRGFKMGTLKMQTITNQPRWIEY